MIFVLLARNAARLYLNGESTDSLADRVAAETVIDLQVLRVSFGTLVPQLLQQQPRRSAARKLAAQPSEIVRCRDDPAGRRGTIVCGTK
jgi:hypothetical protein